MIRQIIEHTQALNRNEIVDIWVYNLKQPCCAHKESVQSVTAYVCAGSSGAEHMINVAYCPSCNRYYINSDQYRSFAQRHGLPYLRLQTTSASAGSPDYTVWNEESILHCMGYSVSTAIDLSAETRRKILMHAIGTRTLTKVQVISFLEFLIHQNEGREHFCDACAKWRNDVEFIRTYRVREQSFVRGKFKGR